jgi:hypothetical protein
MTIYQVPQINGNEIIWSIGMPSQQLFTAADVDNDIAINVDTSIEETHRTMFNKWLYDCNIDTDLGGEAQNSNQQALIRKSFALLCFYAYSKMALSMSISKGNCDSKCEANGNRFLRTLSEDIICKSISNTCVKEKYLAWLHNTCDKKGGVLPLFGSEVITRDNDCLPYKRHYHYTPCENCGS